MIGQHGVLDDGGHFMTVSLICNSQLSSINGDWKKFNSTRSHLSMVPGSGSRV